MPYLQLLATRTKTLPTGVRPPAPDLSFVDRSRLPAGARILSAARNARTTWVVTDRGTFRDEGGRFVPLDLPRVFTPHQPQINADTVPVQVLADGLGHLWLATSHGMVITDGDQWWHALDHRDGMPLIRLTCAAFGPTGDLWAGTAHGAWRLRDGRFRYFAGKRWLPGDSVKAIFVDEANRAWIETDAGYGCIEEKPQTLAQKAAAFDAIVQTRHNRHGLVAECTLKVPGEPEKGFVPTSSDNDGLWTAVYIGAKALEYGVTKSPQAKAAARRAMDALLDLERLTGIPGYPARSIITDDELRAGVGGFDADETVRIDGETDKIWFRSPVDPKVWCKGDTSSDEIDGHYFAWYLYHDLVADDAEKKRVAATVRRVTDHILAHDLTLVGHTGRKTRFGVWTPHFLNEDPRWHEERGLNSVEILCYLKVAHHICGDAKYQAAYDDLVEKHHYLTNTLLYRRGLTWPQINHSDDELAYVSYYPLIRLEKDPARRRILLQSLARTWEDHPTEQTLRAERSPFYNFAYGGLSGNPCDSESAIITLQDWPWDPTDWRMTNRHRLDLTLKQSPIERNRTEADRVLAASERRITRWNADVWETDGGGDGTNEDDPGAWLLGYWLGVYHGYIPAQTHG